MRRLVFSSTCAVYGEPAVPGPLDESNPYRPQSAYGASKVAADLMISAFTRAHQFARRQPALLQRGRRVRAYGERHTTETHLIPLALRTLTEPERVLQILGTDYPTPDGTAVRDYIHVLDLAEAHILALERADPGPARDLQPRQRHRQLGPRGGRRHRRRSPDAGPTPSRPSGAPGDPPMLVGAIDKITKELGWKPQRSLEQIIADAWEFAQTR